MRIVIDARELRTTSGRYVERLLHYLQQADTGEGRSYTVLLKPDDYDGWLPTNPSFTKVVTPYKEFTFSEQTKFLKQIKNMSPDLVHFPFAQQPVLYRGRVVTTIQDLTTCRFRNPTKNWLVFTAKQQIYKWVNKVVARKSQHLITPTEFVREDIAQFAGVSPEKITVTYEAADRIPDPPTPPPQKEIQKANFIMYVGRPLPHKNLWRLVQAFALLHKQHPSLQLVLAGKKDAAYNLIENRARAEGLLEGIRFTGFVDEGTLRWLYEHCSAYVFPSLSEGFGLPALEAMMHGAPVASSNATCLPEVYGDAAHYFDPLDVQDIANKVNDILTTEKLQKTLTERGYARAKSYSWQRMAEQTLAVYTDALKQKQ